MMTIGQLIKWFIHQKRYGFIQREDEGRMHLFTRTTFAMHHRSIG